MITLNGVSLTGSCYCRNSMNDVYSRRPSIEVKVVLYFSQLASIEKGIKSDSHNNVVSGQIGTTTSNKNDITPKAVYT